MRTSKHGDVVWPVVTEIKKRVYGEMSIYTCQECERTILPNPAANENSLGRSSMNGSSIRSVLYYPMNFEYRNDSAGIHIPKGSTTFGYYWSDRPYNVYHWFDPSGAQIGFYFNVTDSTSIEETTISWRDLIVDVFVDDSGTHVLDEDEVPSNIDPTLLSTIEQTKHYILEHYQSVIEEIAPISARLLAMLE